MAAQATRDPFPRLPLLGAAGMIALALLAVLLVPLGGKVPVGAPGDAARLRDLRFEDRADGAIAVYDAGAARPYLIIAPGTEGFVRGAMRAMARERRQGGQGDAAPFRLAAWPGGRLTLEDLETGRRIDLAAFGPTQVESFARMLAAPAAPR
jgi:putative photosynthetic complex assembly protein